MHDRSHRSTRLLIGAIPRLVATLLGLVAGLGASEALLRIVWTPPALESDPFQASHPILGSALIPGIEGRIVKPEYAHSFRITRQGLRGERELTRERTEGVEHRVLFLGDSFTFGLGSANDETFVGRLAERWPHVEVANTGANGYGTREELAILDWIGPAIEPDLTVLCFFWNDLEDIVKHDALRFAVDETGHVRRTAPAGKLGDPLELVEAPPPGARPTVGSYLRHFAKYGLRALRYRTFGIHPRSIRTEEQREHAWSVFEPLLALVARRAEELGSPLVVVAIPDHNQIDPDAVIKNIGPLNFDVQTRLASICKSLGVAYIDLLPGLASDFEERGETLYYYADRHLTPEGNRVAAELLAPRLEAILADDA